MRLRTVRSTGPGSAPGILCLAGFGDDRSMFEPLNGTELARRWRLVTLDLPGFGDEPPFSDRPGTLSNLGEVVRQVAESAGARIVLAHSVASIIATVACSVRDQGWTILSLEGNLTEADAYFSGQAEDYESPEGFHAGFLERLGEVARGDAVLARYRDRVARADARALWVLGREVAAYSRRTVPGVALMGVAEAIYLYNPDNCPKASLEWLAKSGMRKIELGGASHWAPVDAPELVGEAILQALR